MTIQDIIDGIAEALFQEFGADPEIHADKVEQGLKPNSFIIRCLNPTVNKHLGNVYLRTSQFSVQYIPSDVEPITDCVRTMERLFICLEDIFVLGRIVHGTNLHGAVTDDVLTFTVNYDAFVRKEPETVTMEVLEIDTDAKG